ncbi:MAG TPA: D-alanyl-D-alanine carboxypeptidase/D-alanyl-D-alanine-endopeptidase [Pyrinomonadaceae bacterium]|jgi:D-alanyl-D-alanine carboxypeptidase/D-alanyl-D-alanine-endopeptidase (penicillin-binding protein 4)
MSSKHSTRARLFSLLLLWTLCAPAPAQTPTPRPTPAQTPTQTQTQTPTPQATPTPAPTPASPAPRTVEELRARLQALVEQPQFAPALLAAKVASLDTGRVLFEANAAKLLMPASNMKLYTVAAALDRLGPDFRFVTSVYADARPDKDGRVRGDLLVYGRGDPTYATRFNGGDYFKAIDDLAARVAAAGVKSVDGNLVGDESYFTGPALGPGWEWDDLQWYYAAPVSALAVNDNAFDLSVKPGARVGAQALVTTGPDFGQFLTGSFTYLGSDITRADAPALVLDNRVTTAAAGTRRELTVERPLGSATLLLRGSVPLGDTGYTASVAAPRPALTFVAMLRAALQRRGVSIKGRLRALDAGDRTFSPFDPAKLVELARRESPPFSEVAAQTLKPSQNLYAELILRTLGKQFPSSDPKLTTAEAGSAVVRAFLRDAGVTEADRLSLYDGSGLARSNLITAEATLQLLVYMSRQRYAQVWRDALPVAGVDGTLRTRLRDTPAAGNVRAKTGTLNNVATLSGYVTTAAGERLAFSLIVNHYPPDADARRAYLDAAAALLAAFAGRS